MVDAGDAIWLAWRPSSRTPQLYPCKVERIASSSPDSTSVELLFLQDNGLYKEPSEITLRKKAMYDEGSMQSSRRAHLDWGYRSKSVGELDFQLSVHATTGPQVGALQTSHDPIPIASKRRAEENVESRLVNLERGLSDLRGDVLALRGTLDSWDRTVDRMGEYQRSHAMLQEEVRRLKRSTGLDGGPSDAPPPESLPMTSNSASDPLCSSCSKYVAFDAPMSSFLKPLSNDDKMNLGDIFTLPGGRVKANSSAKKLVKCSECMPVGALKIVVCTSGGSGGRRQCNWCRCIFTTNTTDASSGWCGSKHSNCRSLVIENETNRQGNTQFLIKGLAPVKDVTPWDDVKLVDVGLEAFNDADYMVVATNTLGKAAVILEIDNRGHSGGGIYSPAAEREKNDGNFSAAGSFDKVLFLRVNPSGRYTVGEETFANLDKKARWLIVREWIVTFLRYPLGTWTYKDKALVYLFYDFDSHLIDRRPTEFDTVVTYKPPGLPTPTPTHLADWSCALDPYLVMKGSALAQEHLALKDRHPLLDV